MPPGIKTGASKHPQYWAYLGMKKRVRNPRPKEAKSYAGITMCQRWLDDFWNFIEDMGPRPTPKHSIDRIDNTKGYCKENCRWATPKQQSENTRRSVNIEYNGKTQCVRAWSEELNIPDWHVRGGLKKGLTLPQIIEKHKVRSP